jgi:hypothetical protein
MLNTKPFRTDSSESSSFTHSRPSAVNDIIIAIVDELLHRIFHADNAQLWISLVSQNLY